MRVRANLPLLAFLLVMGLTFAASGRVSAYIADVQLDTASIVGTTLTLSGRNFGAGTPSVTIGENAAAVTSHSDVEIVAQTSALAPGMYSLKIVRDANAGGTIVSTLRIE
jgi:hypothetical protein